MDFYDYIVNGPQIVPNYKGISLKNKYAIYMLGKKNKTLIEFNLLSKQNHVVFRTNNKIVQHYVYGDNVIIREYRNGFSNQIYWNGYFLGYCPNIPFHFFGDYAITETGLIFCKRRIMGYKFSPSIFAVSSDGKRIVYLINFVLYEKRITNVDIDNLFPTERNCNVEPIGYCFHTTNIQWIPNSNCISINTYTNTIIIDLDTKEKLYTGYIIQLFVTRNNIIVGVSGKYVIIRDMKKKGNEQLFDNWDQIVNYNRDLDILITSSLQYYRVKRIRGGFELKQITFGMDYFADVDFLPDYVRVIMDTFENLIPSDICHVELYHQIIINMNL